MSENQLPSIDILRDRSADLMRAHRCDKVLSAIFGEIWAITPEMLTTIIGIADRAIINGDSYLSSNRPEGGSEGVVAIIPIHGPIFPRAEGFAAISGAMSLSRISAMFDAAMADPDVAGVVFDVDSPGGLATGIDDFAGRIYAAEKPVAAFVSGMGASAAYWLASATGRIVATRTASVGSIGTVAAWTDDRVSRERKGLKDYEIVSSQSPLKRQDPASDEGRAAIQARVDAHAAIFISSVADFRGVSIDRVTNDFGRGDIVMAENAGNAGMVDAIGTMADAVQWVSNEASQIKTSARQVPARVFGKGRIMDRAQVEAEAPDVVAALLAEGKAAGIAEGEQAGVAKGEQVGAERERKRIQDILAFGIKGDLVEKALFTEPMSAGDFAVAHMKEAAATKTKVLADYKADATGDVAKVPVVPAPAASDETERAAVLAEFGKVGDALYGRTKK